MSAEAEDTVSGGRRAAVDSDEEFRSRVVVEIDPGAEGRNAAYRPIGLRSSLRKDGATKAAPRPDEDEPAAFRAIGARAADPRMVARAVTIDVAAG